MSHTENVTLEFIAEMVANVRAGQIEIKQLFENAIADSKTRDERMRGEIQSLRGQVTVLGGKVESLAGNVVTLTASVEALEIQSGKTVREFAKVDQSLQGLQQLASTNFDQNASILEHLTGTKGADRPKHQTKPGGISG